MPSPSSATRESATAAPARTKRESQRSAAGKELARKDTPKPKRALESPAPSPKVKGKRVTPAPHVLNEPAAANLVAMAEQAIEEERCMLTLIAQQYSSFGFMKHQSPKQDGPVLAALLFEAMGRGEKVCDELLQKTDALRAQQMFGQEFDMKERGAAVVIALIEEKMCGQQSFHWRNIRAMKALFKNYRAQKLDMVAKEHTVLNAQNKFLTRECVGMRKDLTRFTSALSKTVCMERTEHGPTFLVSKCPRGRYYGDEYFSPTMVNGTGDEVEVVDMTRPGVDPGVRDCVALHALSAMCGNVASGGEIGFVDSAFKASKLCYAAVLPHQELHGRSVRGGVAVQDLPNTQNVPAAIVSYLGSTDYANELLLFTCVRAQQSGVKILFARIKEPEDSVRLFVQLHEHEGESAVANLHPPQIIRPVPLWGHHDVWQLEFNEAQEKDECKARIKQHFRRVVDDAERSEEAVRLYLSHGFLPTSDASVIAKMRSMCVNVKTKEDIDCEFGAVGAFAHVVLFL